MEEIPILDAAGISTGNVKEVTVVEVEMKADSKVKQIEFLMLMPTSALEIIFLHSLANNCLAAFLSGLQTQNSKHFKVTSLFTVVASIEHVA